MCHPVHHLGSVGRTVLSQSELRYWIDQFLHNPAMGWSHCKLCFARYLEIDLSGLRSKIRQGRTQAWFRGGEQLRFSARIRRALSGQVAPQRIRAKSGQWKWQAMMADDPKPIRQPGRFRYDFSSRRLEFVPPTIASSEPTLPSFRTAFELFFRPPESQ
jgi:hypothetical protein